jgi:DmsE family decaheme c-type cytochrome
LKGVAVTLSNLFGRLGAIGISGVIFGLAGFCSNAYAAAPGPDDCKGCHESYVDSYAKSIHGQKGHPNSPENAGGCAVCHGDGAAHISAGGGRGVGGIKNPNSKTLSANEKSETCLACHSTSRNLAFWDSGKHKKNDVSCNNCHSIHAQRTAGNDKMLKTSNPSISPYVTTVRQLQYETCVTCHKDIRTAILKTSHHPIIEGKLKCSDCHNPHGSLSPAMVKNDSVNDLCLSCHAEKRGPFISEHPPVAENCLNCHSPHGSQHNKLLAEKMPLLCQDCHGGNSHPTQIWNQKDAFAPFGSTALGTANGPRFVGRSCLNCHPTIHGSNAPANYGQHFFR